MSSNGGQYIDPTRSIAAPPSVRRSIRVARARDIRGTSGLYAIATAAQRLGTIAPRVRASSLLVNLAPNIREGIESRLRGTCLLEKQLRAMARVAGLQMYRPNIHNLEQFREPNLLWISLVMVRFVPPRGGLSSIERHYLLVLDHLPAEGSLIVADPHPWNPPLYCVHESTFEAAWRAAKTKGPPWAAALYPDSGDTRI